jgi:hypothetical protein
MERLEIIIHAGQYNPIAYWQMLIKLRLTAFSTMVPVKPQMRLTVNF